MLTSMQAYLSWFDGVQRRAVRDVGLLPAAADGWTPPAGSGEGAWSINQVVGHMAASRLYFVSAYLDEGWLAPEPPDVSARERWLPALEESARVMRARLHGTPDAWLARKIRAIDSDAELSGWRLLLLLAEHDIHHRSQLNTYAGLNGWDVPDIYGRKWEEIQALQAAERAKRG